MFVPLKIVTKHKQVGNAQRLVGLGYLAILFLIEM